MKRLFSAVLLSLALLSSQTVYAADAAPENAKISVSFVLSTIAFIVLIYIILEVINHFGTKKYEKQKGEKAGVNNQAAENSSKIKADEENNN